MPASKGVPVLPVDRGHWYFGDFSDERTGDVMEANASLLVSAITIQSLADLGYEVDLSQADPFWVGETETYWISGTVLGPDGKPLEGTGIWAWQGKSENSGSGETEPDETFYIAVPEGSFTLDIYTDFEAGCTFVGWYDGAGRLATERSRTAAVVVDNASVEGIEISLPDYPDRLPFIEWCS